MELIYNLALCPRFLRQYVIGVWIKINHVWRYSSVHWLLCDHPTSLNMCKKVKIQCIMPSGEPMVDAFYSKTFAIWYLYIQKLVPFLIPRFGRTLWWGGHHLSGALHIPVINKNQRFLFQYTYFLTTSSSPVPLCRAYLFIA